MGMQLRDLYQFVLLIVLVGMILGAGLLVLVNFRDATGVTGTTAATAINNTINAVSPIGSTWLPLVVTVVILAIILGIVIASFAFGRR
jgi:hypothetical protein